jgi:hypothetical protein
MLKKLLPTADDTPDARLKEPHVVAVLVYAAEDRVLREVLITHDKPAEARQMRSFADETQQVAFIDTPARRLKIAFSFGDRLRNPETPFVMVRPSLIEYRAAHLLCGYQSPPHVVCIRFSKPGGCISDSRSSEPVRAHRRTRAANSFTSARVLPTAVNPR